jgi:hypothetical protein
MTIAIDRKTGAVVGQVLEQLNTGLTLILTRYGYKTVMTSSVKVEEV